MGLPSIIGQCSECCACPNVVVLRAARSVSRSKSGLRLSVDGLDCVVYYLNAVVESLSFDPGSPPPHTNTCTSVRTGIGVGVPTLWTILGGEVPSDCVSIWCINGYGTIEYDPVEQLVSSVFEGYTAFTEFGSPGATIGNASLATLSNPYTTEILKASTLAALAAAEYADYAIGLPVMYFIVNPGETSAIAAADKYKLRHRVPKVGRGTCFEVDWVERFTPAGGGDPVDVERSYAWGGEIPEDYDETDSETWPESEEFEPADPEEEGEMTIGHYEDPEDPESFVEGFPSAVCRGCPA